MSIEWVLGNEPQPTRSRRCQPQASCVCRGAQMRGKCDRLHMVIHSQDANLTVSFVFGWAPCMAVCLEHQKRY